MLLKDLEKAADGCIRYVDGTGKNSRQQTRLELANGIRKGTQRVQDLVPETELKRQT